MRLKDSDTKMVSALAQQTGYWPVFTFFNSMSNMIDLASVGLIGQKGLGLRSQGSEAVLILNPCSRTKRIADRPT
jgi:hypothetical protein